MENEIYYDVYDRPRFVSGGPTSGTVIAKNWVEFLPKEKGTMVKFQLEVKLIGIMRVLELFMKSVILKQKKETLEALNDYITRNQ